MNYFKLFDLPQIFSINKKILLKKFHKLQLQYHPDLFIDFSEKKQEFALKKSIIINQGYQTLKNDLKRAIYLLKINGFNIKNYDFSSNNKYFLLKYFSLYEELDILKKNNSNSIEVNLLSNKVENKIKKYMDSLIVILNNQDWKSGIKIILKLLFFLKIQNDLKKEKDINKVE